MPFEWDPRKAASNMRKHGVSFVAAARALERSPLLARPDTREAYGEERMIALGAIEGEVLAIVYTWRGTNRRLISARRASRHERKAYWKVFPPRQAGP